MVRVRTRPECREDNLRELTRESNPNCGAAREREKKSRARERTFPQKALTQGTAGPLAEQSTGRIP